MNCKVSIIINIYFLQKFQKHLRQSVTPCSGSKGSILQDIPENKELEIR